MKTSASPNVDQATDLAINLSAVGLDYELGGGLTLTAIKAIDLKINRGEFIALTGPSGCGKSTVLRLLAGLEKPTTGQIVINDRAPSEAANQHRIGIAFQDHALLPWLTIRQNVALPFHLAKRPVDAVKIDKLLTLVGLSSFSEARPKQLSGGMRQRAAIARALVLDPEVLLLDEPFAALDAVTRRHLNVELQKLLADYPVTTVLVTHSVEEAAFLADRVIVMTGRPGRVKLERNIDIKRPRVRADLSTPEFHHIADELAAALDGGESSR